MTQATNEGATVVANTPLLSVKNLHKHFPVKGGKDVVKAVNGVGFDVPARRIVGLVGESGSGKTTVGRSILRLIEPTSGSVAFEGQDIVDLGSAEMRALRKKMQIIFQDPFSSLNPRLRVDQIISEALTAHQPMPQAQQMERIAYLLDKVGLRKDWMRRYPHEFSGGQRQRIGIARALAPGPSFIVADESVSALDVSVQAQVLNLLKDLQADMGLTMLFIAHDLGVVAYLCDEIVVMYLGKVMEIGSSQTLLRQARHPYTQALLSAAPVPVPGLVRKRIVLKADIPSPMNAPSGCVFRTRCPHAISACAESVPELASISTGHQVACIRWNDL